MVTNPLCAKSIPLLNWSFSQPHFCMAILSKPVMRFQNHLEGGGWKYKGLGCFTSFLNRQQTYRCHLTVIASWQAYSARAAHWHLYFCCIHRKEVQQSSPLYLIWYFQPPPWGCTVWGTISQSFSNLALPVQITFFGPKDILDTSRWWWVSLPDALPHSSILVIT